MKLCSESQVTSGEYNLVVLKVGHTYPRRPKRTHMEGLSYRAHVPEYGNKRKRKGGGADCEKVECNVFIGRFW